VNSATLAPIREPAQPVRQNLPSSTSSQPKNGRAREIFVRRVRLFWEYRRVFRWATLCGLLWSTLVAFLIPARYEAATQLMPPDSQPGGMPLLTLAGRGLPALGGIASDLIGLKNSSALFVDILQSRTVADRIIEEFQLARVYRVSKIEDARDALAKHTSISEHRKSEIVSIIVTDHDPARAAAMAKAYVSELDRLVAEVSTSSARRERLFLEERLKNVKSELDATALKFSDFASKNTAIDIPTQGKAMVEAVAKLQGELIANESELRGLEKIYTSNNVRVKSLEARITELREQLDKLGTGENTAGATGGSSPYPSIRKLPVLGVTYADLYRQTKIHETVYELLTQQYELAKVQEAKEIPTVRVLDTAVTPTKKSFPPRLLLIAAGTLIAIALASCFVLLRQRWQEMDSNDPGRQLLTEIGAAMRSGARAFVPSTATTRRAVGRALSGWLEQPDDFLKEKKNAALEQVGSD
jgi:uncharacterized protein involved in exopolysaccharide biosynthesis